MRVKHDGVYSDRWLSCTVDHKVDHAVVLLLLQVLVLLLTCPIMWSKVPARASGSWSLLTYLSLSRPVLVSA
jgi:hypothetical protein